MFINTYTYIIYFYINIFKIIIFTNMLKDTIHLVIPDN